MPMTVVESVAVIPVPPGVAACPICSAPIVVEDIGEWVADTGEILSMTPECTTEPDIDSDEWCDWFDGHWRRPYQDWLPLERPILAWLKRTHRVAVG
jgi:hypothetical protein